MTRRAALCLLLLAATALAEKPKQLWLYTPTNLQVKENVAKLEALWKRAAAAGYTHILIADSKMAKLGDLGGMERVYMDNVQRVRAIAAENKLELVPAVFHVGYSNSMLWHDPNLAEGLPVKGQRFIVKDGAAQIAPEQAVSIAGKPSYRDETVTLDGSTATLKSPQGNARISWKLKVAPYRCYHISVQVRTSDFRGGSPEIKALAGNRSLQWQNLGVKPTQDWTEHHVVFNSLGNSDVVVYLGVWGGGRGELQWRNWKIEEAGLVNILRRPGTPLVVEAGGKALVEGKDFDKVVDAKLGNSPWKGEYRAWHEPAALKTRGLADGTELRVSWYHPAIIYDGQVSACLSEPATMALLANEARRVRAAFATRGYMMSHDELRTMNQDHACVARNVDAGAMLADNARACVKLLDGADVYAWSDMFDPHHNAHKDYYLVRGDFAGAWEGLDKRVTIMNWNFGKRDASLKFFTDRGHKQIIAGYYDGDVKEIRKWLESAAKVDGVIGVMYTTWRNDYSHIEEFAKLCKE